MNIKELIKSGKLTEARQQLVAVVRDKPGDLAARTLLFQVLCFCGEWDKADRHLEAIATQDPSREAGVIGYRNLIRAEKERLVVMEEGGCASFLTEPPAYLGLYAEARAKLAEKKVDEAEELCKQLAGQIPAISGVANGSPFAGFRDSDTLLAPFLEVMAHERYLWVPFESLRELSITPPKTLLDLLWVSAHVTTWEGYAMNCFLPVLYPGSFIQEDGRIRLGRMTDWISLGGSLARGIGQHVFDVDGQDMTILEITDVTFNFPQMKTDDEEKH
ncbi:MAG: tetratricopeptide repeat protein [Proteobacteria bacterium]|nr:tetratricopeptide repeat protein [Pseudomonadota bacterium]